MSFPENAARLLRASSEVTSEGLLALRFAFSPQQVVTSIGFTAPLRAERPAHPDAETVSGAA
jgi:hypothetical protein